MFEAQTVIGDLVSSKASLLEVPATTSVEDALSILDKFKILSLPVYGAPGGWIGAGNSELIIGSKQYIGIVSVLDLVAYLFPIPNPWTAGGSLAERLKAPVTSALGSTNESLSLWVESESKPLLVLLELFAKGVHRALVTSADGVSSTKLVSQTDVIKFILSQPRIGTLAGLLDTPLGKLETQVAGGQVSAEGSRGGRLVWLDQCTPLAEAVKLLLQEHTAAAPVLDSGRLLTQLSMSDFRGFSVATATKFAGVSVGDFLKHMHHGTLHKPLVCTASTNLGDLLESMLRAGVHRVWFTTPSGGVEGVVSFTDAIKLVYENEMSWQM